MIQFASVYPKFAHRARLRSFITRSFLSDINVNGWIVIAFASLYGTQHRPFSWTWLKTWCVAWWHSGRDDEDEDEEIAGPESSRTGPGYEETLTPLSAETPLPSTVSRCTSLSAMQVTGVGLDKGGTMFQRAMRSGDVGTSKTIQNEAVRRTPMSVRAPSARSREARCTLLNGESLTATAYFNLFATIRHYSGFPLSDFFTAKRHCVVFSLFLSKAVRMKFHSKSRATAEPLEFQ